MSDLVSAGLAVVGSAVIAASVVLPEADCLPGWYGGVNLLIK